MDGDEYAGVVLQDRPLALIPLEPPGLPLQKVTGPDSSPTPNANRDASGHVHCGHSPDIPFTVSISPGQWLQSHIQCSWIEGVGDRRWMKGEGPNHRSHNAIRAVPRNGPLPALQRPSRLSNQGPDLPDSAPCPFRRRPPDPIGEGPIRAASGSSPQIWPLPRATNECAPVRQTSHPMRRPCSGGQAKSACGSQTLNLHK